MTQLEEKYMREALALAASAATNHDEVPVGAVIVLNDEIIGTGYNAMRSSADPTAHAEVMAIRAACSDKNEYRLPGSTLYTTLEPCALCAGAIVLARIARVVIAAKDPKSGAAGSVINVIPNQQLNHRPEIEFGILEAESREMLQSFFREKRAF